MKAARFSRFGAPIEIVDLPSPDPPPGGVVIEVEAAGICRSDWHAWQGHDSDIKSLPHVLGHEFAGTIAAVGAGVHSWKVGARVTAPFACGCGTCKQCASGNTQVCPDQYQPGVTGPGAFAELVALPFAETNLVRLPEEVAFTSAAALGCRFATAYRALAHPDQANVQPGERVAIFGCGGVGLSAVMIAADLGAEVIAIDVRPDALAAASALGATQALLFDDVENLQADVTVDALGKTGTFIAALNSLAPRGRHLQIGLMLADDAAPAIPIGQVIANEQRIIGSHGMGASAYPQLLAKIADGSLEPEKLVAGSIPLTSLPAAIENMGTFSNESGISLVTNFDS